MSRAADGKFVFGPWLPDLPPHDNPGLVTASNVIWLDGAYRGFKYVTNGVGVTFSLPARPQGGISVVSSAGTAYVYAGTGTTLYVRSGASFSSRTSGSYTTAAAGFWRFVQFDDYVIATNYGNVPQKLSIGSGSNFSDLAVTGTAPKARVAGVVGRHLVLGDLDDGSVKPYSIRWCRIDDPTEWPVPNSTDALNKQAGEQLMPSKNGPVTGIVGNDQFGIVIQETGVSRMTYVAGDLVYQFDEIDGNHGSPFPNGIVQVGDLAYFLSNSGLCVTDGVSVKDLSAGKFSSYIGQLIQYGYKERVYGAYDVSRALIYWILPGSGAVSGRPNKVLVYNLKDDRATIADDQCEVLFQWKSADGFTRSQELAQLYTFDSTYKLSSFSGSGPVGTIETGEFEPNPGLHTFISGVKPIINRDLAIGVSLGYRSSFGTAVTYTSAVAPTSRTGFADFRVEARYFSARITYPYTLNGALGFELQQTAGGA